MSVCCPLSRVGILLFMCFVLFTDLFSVKFHSPYFASRNQLPKFKLLTFVLIYLSGKVDKRKIGDSLSEFYFEIVLSAFAAQDNSTSKLTQDNSTNNFGSRITYTILIMYDIIDESYYRTQSNRNAH